MGGRGGKRGRRNWGGYMYEDGRLTDAEEEGEGGRGDGGVGGGKE